MRFGFELAAVISLLCAITQCLSLLEPVQFEPREFDS